MISKRVCQAHQLSWTEIEPGRLVHIRIHGKTRSVDFIAIYQHVFSTDRLIQRQRLLDKLNDVLSKLPQRNLLVLLGDFNTSLMTRSKVVGTGTFMHNGKKLTGTTHTDSQDLHDLLRQHSLLALNTWMTDNSATFTHGNVSSRLDFVCCRQVHADHTAKRFLHAQCNRGTSHPSFGLGTQALDTTHTADVCQQLDLPAEAGVASTMATSRSTHARPARRPSVQGGTTA